MVSNRNSFKIFVSGYFDEEYNGLFVMRGKMWIPTLGKDLWLNGEFDKGTVRLVRFSDNEFILEGYGVKCKDGSV